MKKILFAILTFISTSSSAQRMLVLNDTPFFANQNKGVMVLRLVDNLPYYSNGKRWVAIVSGSVTPSTIRDSILANNNRIVTSYNGKRKDVFGVDSIYFSIDGKNMTWRYNNILTTKKVLGVDTIYSVPTGDSVVYRLAGNLITIKTAGGGGGGSGVTLNPTLGNIPKKGGTNILLDSKITESSLGNIGINSTSPTNLLDVNGSAIIRDTLTITTMATTDISQRAASTAFVSIKTDSAWKIGGNAGTNPSTNFIGTTDNQDVVFKRNNLRAGFINNDRQSTYFGVNGPNPAITGLFQNTVYGNRAGQNMSGTASRNNLFGVAAGENLTGNDNNVFGATFFNATTAASNSALGTALQECIGCSNNSAVGNNSQRYIRNGTLNSSLGVSSMQDNRDGTRSVGVGVHAALYDTSFNFSTAVGYGAFTFAQNTSQGTAIGYNSFELTNAGTSNNTGLGAFSSQASTSGNRITAIGANTGNRNRVGNNLTFLGYSADVTGDGISNSTAIGMEAAVGQSNAIVLGATVGINGYFGPKFNIGIGTATPDSIFHVVGGLKFVNGTQGAGKVLTSDASGGASWQTSSSSGWGLTGNAGTNPATNFLGTTDAQPLKFRVKNIDVGEIGLNNDLPTFKIGNQLSTNGESSTAFGVFNEANGVISMVVNNGNIGNGDYSFTAGQNNLNNSQAGTVLGTGNISIGDNQTIIGSYNDTVNKINKIFEVGIGDDLIRKSGFSMLKSGNLGIGTTTPASKLQVDGGITPKLYTVATLPSGQPTGTLATVSDALAPSYLVAVVGGGSVVTPVFYNGTTWVAH